ncbi:MAG: GHMP kinase [Deltaproteobacteria bacterium]|nr:GHMP kinase [Deltaproteobacteria bacterium]
MIITRTPFRVSFAGGGTDLPEFYRGHGYGAVVSATIKKYMYIVIHPYFHDKIRIKYSKTEDVEDVDSIEHPIVRECLRRVGVETGVEIASFADVSAGTGLGSSSSFTVGLLHALYAYKGKMVSRDRLAGEACEIEIDRLQEPIGKQDQYAAAFGGLNHIRFNRDETVEVTPVLLGTGMKKELESRFRLYYVGGSHNARDILQEQQENIRNRTTTNACLENMLRQVQDLTEVLAKGEIAAIGSILHDGWLQKKKLSTAISNAAIDILYDQARMCGSSGGKLLGAGGAGFLLLDHANHDDLAGQMGCKSIPLELDSQGSKVIFFE